MINIHLVDARFLGPQNIYIRRVADHDTLFFQRAGFQQRIFENLRMRFQTIGSFGSDDFTEIIVYSGSLQFMVLRFFKSVGDQVKFISFSVR